MSPLARSSEDRPLCQSCSDVIETSERRRRTDDGLMHADCADAEHELRAQTA